MILLNKFVKFTYNINENYPKKNMISYNDVRCIIYRKNTSKFLIYYNNSAYEIQRNTVRIKHYERYGKNSLNIQVYLKESEIDIYSDLSKFLLVSISYNDEYTNRSDEVTKCTIDFSKKDDARMFASHKHAIDTYSYLREYFSAEKKK